MVIILILIMFPSSVQYDKQSLKIGLKRNQTIEHKYVVYVPKTVTFRYNTSPSKHQQSSFYSRRQNSPPNQQKLSANSSGKKIVMLSRKKKFNKSSIGSSIKSKLHVYSLAKNSGSSTRLPQDSRVSYQSGTLPFIEQNSHISTHNHLRGFTCDIFSHCNELDRVDEGQGIPGIWKLNIQESGRSHWQQDREIKIPQKLKMSARDPSGLNHSFGSFSKRKRIFDTSAILNNSVDLSVRQKRSRSKSRKGIFERRQKAQMSQSSLEREQSFSSKNRIFDSPNQKLSPRFGMQSHQKQLNGSLVPKCIMESWQQFSQSNQSIFDQRQLEVVQQSNNQQSQMELID